MCRECYGNPTGGNGQYGFECESPANIPVEPVSLSPTAFEGSGSKPKTPGAGVVTNGSQANRRLAQNFDSISSIDPS